MESQDPRATALAFVVAKGIGSAAAAVEKQLRARADEVFRRKDRIPVYSPYDDEVELGTVSMTNPSLTAVVDDEPAFTAWMADQYPDQCETVQTILPGPQPGVLSGEETGDLRRTWRPRRPTVSPSG